MEGDAGTGCGLRGVLRDTVAGRRRRAARRVCVGAVGLRGRVFPGRHRAGHRRGGAHRPLVVATSSGAQRLVRLHDLVFDGVESAKPEPAPIACTLDSQAMGARLAEISQLTPRALALAPRGRSDAAADVRHRGSATKWSASSSWSAAAARSSPSGSRCRPTRWNCPSQRLSRQVPTRNGSSRSSCHRPGCLQRPLARLANAHAVAPDLRWSA